MTKKNLYSVLNNISPIFKKVYSRRLRVLAYHSVPDKKAFDAQLKYLSNNYNIINIDKLKAHLFEGQNLPKRPLLITFDDGDFSVYENGLPVLKKYKLDSCLFIITHLINSKESVWIKKVEKGEMNNGKTYADARKEVARLKKIPNSKRIEEMKKFPSVSEKQLSTKELLELSVNKVFIGNHTHTHPMLDKCNKKEIILELENARKTLLSLGFEGYDIFAYPNGNEDEASNKILKEEGIKMAFLFDHKVNSKNINPLSISRIMVDSNTELNEFKTKVSGLHPFLFNLKSLF